jgi:DNA-directed RNA polymerase I and III subunit RPAC2
MKRIRIKYILKKNQSIFTFYGQGHTLGNVLRYTLKNIKNIDFSGYNVPHPTENLMNLKIVTKNSTNHIQILLLALKICGELSVLTDNLFLLTIENYSRICF